MEPNLRPAMKTMLAASGKAAIASRDSRSASMHSMPCDCSRSRSPASEKRATPITRLPGAARLAIRASVGPILPPTPSTMMSPGTVASASTRACEGRDIASSSASTSVKYSVLMPTL